jgi:SulP family sulfate permease
MVPAWVRRYRRNWLSQDLVAGLVVTVMLVPQGLAYAMLAGMPPVTGLYAAILPLVVYALVGSSMTLAVGPVAITSLMTAAALAPLYPAGSPLYVAAALALALIGGLALLLFGLLRLGFLAQLLSRPVVSGFTTGAGLLILVSQLGPLLGVAADGETTLQRLLQLGAGVSTIDPATAALGLAALVSLVAAQYGAPALLQRCGMSANSAAITARLSPMLVVLLAILVVVLLDLDRRHGVAVIGAIPAGWPEVDIAALAGLDWRGLIMPALLIGLVSFLGSLSMAQSLAARRRERIDANAELRGLGAANIASALSGAFPISGGFARSVVNFAAGARSPLAGIVSAALMVLVLLALTGLFERLPLAVLAATIIAALPALIDLGELRRTCRYDRGDAAALLVTVASVVALGVEQGLLIGIGLSLLTLLWRAGHPHIAELGRMPGTEHFRNIERHQVETLPHALLLRIDENLFFGNVAALEQHVARLLAEREGIGDVVLALSSVSHVDTSAMEALRELNAELIHRDVRLHLAEVKGPVMDHLLRSPLPGELSGEIHLSLQRAFVALAGTPDWEI